MKHAASVAILVLVAGCGSAVAPPGEAGPLRLETTVNRSSISFGDTATVTHRLTNIGTARVDLTFGSSCVVLPFITGEDPDQVVYPEGGGWMCAAVLTPVSLEPGESRSVSVAVVMRVTRNEQPPAIVELLPGRYLTFARVEVDGLLLRSVPVHLAVR